MQPQRPMQDPRSGPPHAPTYGSRTSGPSSRAGRGSGRCGGRRAPRDGTRSAAGSLPRAGPVCRLEEAHGETLLQQPPPKPLHQQRHITPSLWRKTSPQQDQFCQSLFPSAADTLPLTQLAGQPRPPRRASAEPRGWVTRATVLAEAALAAAPPVETRRARCGNTRASIPIRTQPQRQRLAPAGCQSSRWTPGRTETIAAVRDRGQTQPEAAQPPP